MCTAKQFLRLLGPVLLCAAFSVANVALAQFSSPGGGVDDSNGVFQLEGNATKDTGICFNLTGGPEGGPLIATPGAGNSCAGSGFSFIAFGGQTEDWVNIFCAKNPNVAGCSGISSAASPAAFVFDKFNDKTDNQYTGGSTKDVIDLPNWLWKNGTPQGKDDIEHAYAAVYARADGHLILVTGVDRWDNSGDSTMGFWFVKDSTAGSGVTGTCSGAGCPFGGTHADGDLLIVSDFSQGGPVASIVVYQWKTSPAGNCTGNLCLVTSIPGAAIGECNPKSGNKDLCGIVPDQDVAAPWAFFDKHLGATSNMEKGEFLEIGLDLSVIYPDRPCFSTFWAETRASNSPTSTLSDFTTPVPFALCGISATKQCTGANIDPSGTTVTYNFSGNITATGVQLSNLTYSDNPNNCGYQSSSVSGNVGTCTTTGSRVFNLVLNAPNPSQTPSSYSGSFQTDFISSTMDNLVKASASIGGQTVTMANGASWLVNGTLPGVCAPKGTGCLNVTKNCAGSSVTSGNPLALRFDFSGTITNGANVQVSNVTITDSKAGTTMDSIVCLAANGCSGTAANGGFTLAPVGWNGPNTAGFATYTGHYTESGSGIICDPVTGTNSGTCKFTDSVTASGTGSLGSGVIHECVAASADCYLCPSGACRP